MISDQLKSRLKSYIAAREVDESRWDIIRNSGESVYHAKLLLEAIEVLESISENAHIGWDCDCGCPAAAREFLEKLEGKKA